jgi:hypothetical protein
MSIEDRKAQLELTKLELENTHLKADIGFGWIARQLWPIISTILTVVLSTTALYLSLSTQNRQINFQQAQAHQQSLARALELATDGSNGTDRRVAGIWQLNEYWREPGDQRLVASTLAAELALPDEHRFARCAAAEVIGGAIASVPAENRPRLAQILFGSAAGELGVVIRQHQLLRTIKTDLTPSSDCQTALDATREAIRKSSTYLREVNLDQTDLSAIQLFGADLHGARLIGSVVTDANIRCANMSNVNLDGAGGWQSLDFTSANVRDLQPITIRKYALDHGAVEMTDEQWLAWRAHGFTPTPRATP